MKNDKYSNIADRAGCYHEIAEYHRKNFNMNAYCYWKKLELTCISEYNRQNSYTTR